MDILHAVRVVALGGAYAGDCGRTTPLATVCLVIHQHATVFAQLADMLVVLKLLNTSGDVLH